MKLKYECSSKGDKRLSAFYAIMPDGRSIEQHYQCDVKGYDVGGTNWRKGKGKPPLDTSKNMFSEYCGLWYYYFQTQPELAKEVREICESLTLIDMFSKKGCVNQAAAITWLVEEGWI